MKSFECPIWLTLSKKHKKENIKFIRVTNKLEHFYTKTINELLKAQNIKFKFNIKTYYHDDDPNLKIYHEKMYDYAMKNENIIASKVNRVFGDPKKSFSIEPKNKIIFTESDISWKEDIHDLVYDLTPNTYSNMELVKWISEQTNYENIYYLHHPHSPPLSYKKLLNDKNKNKFKSVLIELDRDGFKTLKNTLSKLTNKSLLITNIDEFSIENGEKKLSKALLNQIEINNIRPDIISLEGADYVYENYFPNLNILFNTDAPPWSFYLTEKLISKICKEKDLKTYFINYITNQFDFYNMIAEIINKRKLSYKDDNFIGKIDAGIKSFDNKYDIYLGHFNTFSFSNRKNNQYQSFINRIPASTKNYEDNENRTIILHNTQIFKQLNKMKKKDVVFVYIDLIKIFFIDIERGIWGAEIVCEIISKHNDPIKLINFNNLSVTNPLLNVEKVRETLKEETGYKTFMYHVTANFAFDPAAEYYPFDFQDIFIEYSLKDFDEAVLQPVPKGQLDYDFKVDGWHLVKPYSSVRRSKNYLKTGTNLSKQVYLNNISRYGFILKRYEPANLIKSLAPLSFLTLIAYYCLYVPFEEIYNTISFLVVIFLAGIALYFSSDRPQPLSFSLIDKMFQFFYLVAGINLLYSLSVGLNFEFIKNIQEFLIFIEPILCFAFIFYVLKQKKDVETSF